MNKYKIYAFADEASSEIDKQILAMKRNQLDGIEIRNVDGTNISEIALEKAKEVRNKLDAAGLVTWSIGSPIGKIDIENGDFSAHIETFKHTLEISSILGCENIRMFSFYMPEDKDCSIYKNEVIDRLGRLCEIAAGSGISLCHENEKGIYGDTPEKCLEIFSAVHGLKGIFDPANFVQSGVDTLKAWEMLKHNIYYMHIKDSLADGTIVPAGEGGGNIPQIARKYLENGGNAFTIEAHLVEFEGLAGLEREGEKSVIKNQRFSDADTAFDAACKAFKNIL